MSKENRVSDEQLAKLAYAASLSPHLADQLSVFRELQSLRSKPVAGVEVKRLEWEKHNVDGTMWTSQVTVCGEYKVKFQGDKWDAWVGILTIAKAETCDEAKAAAEADYHQRILSALSLPAQEPVAWLSRGHGAVIVFTVHSFMRDEWAAKGMEITPLYASPQPEAVITDEMVERAYVAWLAGTHAEDWEVDEIKSLLRATLTAALKEA